MKKYRITNTSSRITENKRMYHGGFNEEKPISPVYPVIDNDVARDNIENDLSAADLQDL